MRGALHARYWVIPPFSNKRKDFAKVWAFDLENSVISIGFTELPNVSHLSEKQLRQLIERRLRQQSTYTKNYFFRSLWNFYHSIKRGDVIVACEGRKKILAIGRVRHSGYYEYNKNPDAQGEAGPYSNHLGVRWRLFNKSFDDLKFSRLAIDQISEEDFQKLTRGRGASRKADPEAVSIEAQIVDSPQHKQLDYKYRSKAAIRKAEKVEERLLIDFRKWLRRQERTLEAAKFGSLRCDGYERKRRMLIEAKSSVSREHIRMAVGQLLDYGFQIRKNLGKSHMAILLPRKPDPSSVAWLPILNISLIWRENGAFFDNANGKMCGHMQTRHRLGP